MHKGEASLASPLYWNCNR